jgi:hypothetical protein
MSRPVRASALLLAVALLSLLAPVRVGAQAATPDAWRKDAATISDSFARDTGQWTIDTGPDTFRSISRGRLTVRVPEAELLRWSTLDSADAFDDFYVEVDATPEAGPADGMLGIIFRYEDSDNFYAFLVSADGWYSLLKYAGGEVSRPIDWNESGALKTGKGAENKLGVLANGREIAIYANGEELDSVQDRSFAAGRVALVAGTNKDGDLEASFDNFGLWNRPENSSSEPTTGRKSIKRSTPAAPEQPANAPDAVVNSDLLNVRGGPGTNYPVVGTLKKGDGVEVVGRSADSKWAKLGFTDVQEAWASAQYLTFNTDFGKVALAKSPTAPAAPPKAPAPPAKKNVAWLVIENHIGRYITLQVNDQNYRVEGKVGDTPGRFQFELRGVGRYQVAAQLPNGGSHNWDLYVEPTPDKCVNRQGCVALGQTFLQTYY